MPERLLAPAAMATLLCLTTAAASAETPNTMDAEQGWSSIKRCAQEDTERGRHTCLDRVLREAGVLTDEMHARQQRRAFGLEDKPVRAPAPSASGTPATATGSASATPAVAASSASKAASAPVNVAPAAAASGSAAASAAAMPSAPANASTNASAPALASAPAVASASAAPAATAKNSLPPPSDRLEVELARVDKAANGRLFVTTTEGAVWLQNETVDMPQPPMAGDRMTIRKGPLGGYRCTVASTQLTYRCIRNR
jgi:hypothetical protein